MPGHTRGSVVYLLDGEFLFTGDSLAWDFEDGDLAAYRDVCWYDWDRQLASLCRVGELLEFSWVLPGHGGHVNAPAAELRARLQHRLAEYGG